MTNWSQIDPGAGDLTGAQNAHGELTTAETSVTDLHTALTTALKAIDDKTWSSSSGSTWRHSLHDPMQSLHGMSGHITSARRAVNAYVTAVNGIKQHEAQIKASMDGVVLSYDVCYDPTLLAQKGLTMADINAALTRLQFLAGDRETADAALVTALKVPADKRYQQAKSVLASMGITTPDKVNLTSISDAFSAYAKSLNTKREWQKGDTSKLQDFFDVFGHDQLMMSNFYQKLGGDGTANFISRLGNSGGAAGLGAATMVALGKSMRSGLASGSRIWTPDMAKDFAAGLFTTVGADAGRQSAIGYLFSDSSDPVGENLAVAAANQLDAWERTDPDAAKRGPFMSRADGSGFELGTLEWGEDSTHAQAMGDPASMVFSTLGDYPQASLDWLTGPDSKGEPDRVDYWFRDRDWSTNGPYGVSDGYTGIAKLLTGAERAPGGPSNGPGVDMANWKSIADVTSRAVHGLAANEGFKTGVSPDGSVALAKLISVSTPEIGNATHDGRFPDDSAVQNIPIIGYKGRMPIAAFSDNDLVKLFHQAASTEDGYKTLSAGITTYQDGLVGYAQATGQGGANVMEQVGTLQGLVDGSADFHELAEASEHDERIEHDIDDVKEVVGAIPLPEAELGGEVATKAGAFTIDYFKDQALKDVAGHTGEMTWADHYDATRDKVQGGLGAREANFQAQIEALRKELGVPAEIGSTEEGPQDSVGLADSRYGIAYQAGLSDPWNPGTGQGHG